MIQNDELTGHVNDDERTKLQNPMEHHSDQSVVSAKKVPHLVLLHRELVDRPPVPTSIRVWPVSSCCCCAKAKA
jgi:hypothetical protein